MNEIELRTDCCFSPINEAHYSYCDVGVDQAKIDASFKQDGERWKQSYTIQNSEGLRIRAKVLTNGHHAYRYHGNFRSY